MTEREFADRLVLGTAQFGLAYGINNTTGQPPLAQVADILREARAAGVTVFDTAAAYGDAEARLGQLLPEAQSADVRLITKINITAPEQIRPQVEAGLVRLGRGSVDGVLLHNAGVAGTVTPAIWRALQSAQTAGLVARIGISCYSTVHLEEVLAEGLTPEIVQLPVNVLDSRRAWQLPHFAERGIEFHARSAFLQGLLLREPGNLPKFFRPLDVKLRRLHELAAAAGVPLPALLLLFVAQTPGVARVVIGVDSVANLHDNLRAAQHWDAVQQIRPQLARLAEPDDTFLLPYQWPKA